MKAKFLSTTDIYTGTINDHKNLLSLDIKDIKENILYNYINENFKDKIKEDVSIENSKDISNFDFYIRDMLSKTHFDIFLSSKKITMKNAVGNVFLPQQQSTNRSRVNLVDYYNSPDYTVIFAVDVKDNSSNLIVEYSDHRRRGRSWDFPVLNNYYWIFPASLRYYISKNKSEKINTFLTLTYEDHKHIS